MSREIPVLIKRLSDNAVIPQYATTGAAGFDLVAVEDVVIEPGETALVKTGLAVALPPGYEMQIRPRSGLSLNSKLRVANSPGTIDADYRGEICIIIDNGHTVNYRVESGMRIAQGVITEVPRAVFAEVDTLDDTERGVGGFGSTGVGLYDIETETDGQLAFDFPVRPEVSE